MRFGVFAACVLGFGPAWGAHAEPTDPESLRPVPTGIQDSVRGPPGPHGEQLTIDPKGVTLAFPGDVATLRIGGRLQLDFGAAAVRPPFGDATENTAAVRRAWIEPRLSLRGGWEFAFQYDFSNAQTPIYDALIAYRGLEPFIVTVGNMKEPFFLDRLTGNNDLLFTERAIPDAFNPVRSFGAAVGANGKRWTLVAGAYGQNANLGIAGDGVAGVTRATYAPILDDTEVFHIGLASSLRVLDRRGPDLTFGSQPETFLFSERRELVDTGAIADAATVRRAGLETAYRYGPFLVQAEYVSTSVERHGVVSPLVFQGGYVQGGWVLNGRGREYKVTPDYGTTYAVFGGVEVQAPQRVSRGGIGVFELGARFSVLDLSDRSVRGGLERDVSIGLNWYPEANVKLMADYVRARAKPTVSHGERVVEADIFIGRMQLYW